MAFKRSSVRSRLAPQSKPSKPFVVSRVSFYLTLRRSRLTVQIGGVPPNLVAFGVPATCGAGHA